MHCLPAMESASQDVLKELISSDMGLAFVERFAIQKELKRGKLREIKITEGAPKIELGICYLKKNQSNPVVQAFLSFIKEGDFDT